MLPDHLLNCRVAGSAVVPHFLAEHDHFWLRSLLEEYERFVGRPIETSRLDCANRCRARPRRRS